MLAMAATGQGEGLWLRAKRQTAGRGRLGRRWAEADGNLYTSTIVKLMAGDPGAATLGFLAAVALDEVLCAYAPDVAFRIKWPNDVLANGAKISGILLERGGDAVVVGIGVNLAAHPEGLDRPTSCVRALTGSAPDPAVFVEHLADIFTRWLARWRGEGLAPVLSQWNARAHPLGTPLQAILPDGTVSDGLFNGLGSDGALKLRLADGSVRAIHAGDVFLV